MPDSFDRILSARDLLRGRARAALLWATFAGAALFAALTTLLLLLGLFEHRGQLQLSPAEYQVLQLLADLPGLDGPAFGTTDSGLLPTVWIGRSRLPGVVASQLYRSATVFHHNWSALLALSLGLLLLGVVWSLAVTGCESASAGAGRQAGELLRKGIHRQAMRLAPTNLRDLAGGEVLDLFENRTERIGRGVSRWLMVLTRDSVELAAVTVFLLLVHWRIGMLCLIPVVVCLYVLEALAHRFEQRDRLARDRATDELELLSAGLGKSRLVLAYGMEEAEQERFLKTLKRYYERIGDVVRGQRMHRLLSRLTILGIALVILYFVIGDRVLRQSGYALPLADAVMICASLIYLAFPLRRLLALRSLRTEVAVDAGHVHRYIDRVPQVGQAVGARFLEPLSRVLQFDSVSYADASGPLLQNLDLKVPAGEVIALVSSDPAEARALAWMVPRFIEPSSGRVLIDGEDIAWVTLESLRAEAVFVDGDQPYFTGTVLENLTCGETSYSPQQATEAAKLTHAHKFILELPAGYETQLGEHGEQLTPGQAFRLSLARAALRKPALLIIEEPRAPMDGDDKALIEDAYTRLLRGRTAVILPTRLTTVKRADRVVFVSQGRVAATGTQESLVRSSPLYRHWEYTQFNEFRSGRR